MKRIFTNSHGLNKRCRSILLLILCLISFETFASRLANSTAKVPNVPPKTVTGTINDQNGGPLPGVSVKVKDKNIGAVTDINGKFTISVPEGSNVLVISFIGFKTQEISVESRSSININLAEDASKLDEVVIVGYGSQSREVLTTSISKIDKQVLETIPYSNVGSALQGTAPGVLVQSTSGQPGAAPRIIIRGGTSINNPGGSAPLYIVDGVIRPDLNHINSEDIESMQVLKDAASTSIYGARASNGVVLITTKSGKSGKMEISYNYDNTFSEVGKTYDMASAHDYIYYARLGLAANEKKIPGSLKQMADPIAFGTGNDLTENTAFTPQYLTPANQHKLNEGWKSMPDPLDPSKTIIYAETDWQDVLFRTGVSQNHHLSFTGGTDKATLNAGVGYMQNDGIAITSKYNRFSGTLNGTLKLRDNLSLFSRVMYSGSSNREIDNLNNVFFRNAGMAPTTKYTFEDGSLAPGTNQATGNPAYYLNKAQTDANNETLTLIGGGQLDILPGLSFKPQVSLYKTDFDNYYFMPSFLTGANRYNTVRQASSRYSKLMQTQVDATFSYNKSFQSAHNVDATAGYTYFGRNLFDLSAVGSGAVTDRIPTLNAISTMTSMSGSTSKQVIMGYFGRLNYDFKRKYLVSLNLRYDGASNLGAKNRWGYFPGVALGWNLHEEKFWRVLPENLLRMKLRGSYGATGNIGGLSDFQAQGSYSVGNQYMGASAVENTGIANPDLKWENSKTFNLGADLGIFNRKVNVIFDVYRRVTEDLITDLALPLSTGFSRISTNFGSLENKGLEIEIGTQIINSKKEKGFTWDVSFNAAKTQHKILKLPTNGIQNNRVGGAYVWDTSIGGYAWVGGLQEGGRIGDYYAWRSLGVYSTDADASRAPIDMAMNYPDKTKYGGDNIFDDLDKNGIIDTKDLAFMGNPYPKWTGGFSNSISYKGFKLYARMDYMTGHTIYNYAKIFLSGQWASGVNFPKEMVTEAWHKQGDIATYPLYRPGVGNYNFWRTGASNTTTATSLFYESGDFLCLREISLSYNLPHSILKNIKVNNVRFNISGNNLYYFTKYTGMNPEEGGRDFGRYPLPKNIIFGAVVSF